jgi:hypothetical protein
MSALISDCCSWALLFIPTAAGVELTSIAICCFFDQFQVEKFRDSHTQKSRQNVLFGAFSVMFERFVRTSFG